MRVGATGLTPVALVAPSQPAPAAQPPQPTRGPFGPQPERDVHLLEQRFRYTYETPVRRLRHRLMVVPPVVHGRQHRLGHRVTTSGDPVLVSERSDGFGNHVVEVRATAVAEWIEFASWTLLATSGPPGVAPVPARAARDRRLLQPTALTRAEFGLDEVARELAGAGPGGLAMAERACTWSRRALTYEYGVTGVRTTAAEAVAGGRGVCQDYAHVMLALCRAAGLACRYVSGHLVGEGGSHAWVEVVVPDESSPGRNGALAVAFDPTHDRRAGRDYFTVGVGRDYRDVAPTSGTFEGDAPGLLTAGKRLRRLDADAAVEAVAAGSTHIGPD
ncbi:MAG TPA: transglutaminase family protein [Acidimicrobiales bacterium]|nr:transglutaminase family protein [Acidimicrobiales bacterium]